MELQLGLALPTYNPNKGFDLNNLGFEPKDQTSGLKSWKDDSCFHGKTNVKNKRRFEEAFGKIRNDQSRMMPLLLWSGQPNEEDDQKGQKKRTSPTINEKEEEETHVVGWPPIQSWRKKLLHQHHEEGQVGRIGNNNRIFDNHRKENGRSNSMYVKVKMEGVAIARKIDLKRFHSFHTLTNCLIPMFATYHKSNKSEVNYTLTYQDKEGDWLLAGDVPWKTFMESVQRLEILKNGG